MLTVVFLFHSVLGPTLTVYSKKKPQKQNFEIEDKGKAFFDFIVIVTFKLKSINKKHNTDSLFPYLFFTYTLIPY